jgi:hypothetical protein
MNRCFSKGIVTPAEAGVQGVCCSTLPPWIPALQE